MTSKCNKKQVLCYNRWYSPLTNSSFLKFTPHIFVSLTNKFVSGKVCKSDITKHCFFTSNIFCYNLFIYYICTHKINKSKTAKNIIMKILN